VLVVRRPAYASYRCVLAAVELDLEARAIIAAAHALSRGPHVTVLHVLASGRQALMSAVELPERASHAQCDAAALSAREALKDLIASAGATKGGQSVILLGNAAHGVIEQQLANGADLLVLGKRPGNPIIDALHGGVVQVAISSADADVLILPTMPSAPDASSRPRDFAWAPIS
jgi:nucleotide-binding universal stress UspA family protein